MSGFRGGIDRRSIEKRLGGDDEECFQSLTASSAVGLTRQLRVPSHTFYFVESGVCGCQSFVRPLLVPLLVPLLGALQAIVEEVSLLNR
jgi:hypothetical protein